MTCGMVYCFLLRSFGAATAKPLPSSTSVPGSSVGVAETGLKSNVVSSIAKKSGEGCSNPVLVCFARAGMTLIQCAAEI